MGNLIVTGEQSDAAFGICSNIEFHNNLMNMFFDYFENNDEDIEVLGLRKAIYLKAIVLDYDTPEFEGVFGVWTEYNDWLDKYRGKVITLQDNDTGVRYSHVVVIGGVYDTEEQKLLIDTYLR